MEAKNDALEPNIHQSSELARRDEFSDIDYKKEQSVSAPISGKGVGHFFMNLIVPGSGSIAHGKTRLGLYQIGGVALGIPLLFFKWYLGLIAILFAYAWSFVTGLGFLKERDFPEDWS